MAPPPVRFGHSGQLMNLSYTEEVRDSSPCPFIFDLPEGFLDSVNHSANREHLSSIPPTTLGYNKFMSDGALSVQPINVRDRIPFIAVEDVVQQIARGFTPSGLFYSDLTHMEIRNQKAMWICWL
jgi:hypothetical protein